MLETTILMVTFTLTLILMFEISFRNVTKRTKKTISYVRNISNRINKINKRKSLTK